MVMNDGERDTSRVYAWMGRDKDGIEGIMVMTTAMGITPLLTTDEQMSRDFEPYALESARARGHQEGMKLVVFERGVTLKQVRL